MSVPSPDIAASPLLVRDSAEDDMAAVTAIYGEHVSTGLASFEEIPPTLDEMRRRRTAILALGLPYLVAECGGAIVGFAYAGRYRERAAYRLTVEDSVYVDAARRGGGIGRLLLAALIERCTDGGGDRQFGQCRVDRAARPARIPDGRGSALGRVQARPVGGFGHDVLPARRGRQHHARRKSLLTSPLPVWHGDCIVDTRLPTLLNRERACF